MPTRVLRLGTAIAIGVCLAAAIAPVSQSFAQSYPSKPIRFFVPFPAGGSTDAVARAMQPALEKILGQPVVVENRAGAGGTLGVDAVAKAPPDGYTIGLAGAGALGVNIGERTKRMYDPAKDLAPISRAAESPFILVATPALNVEHARRRDQARQGRAQPHVDRPRRQRHGDAARRHDVRHHGRCENQPGALSRHSAGGDRRDRRPRPARHRRSAAVDGRHQRRQAQGDRGFVEAALLGVSRCADLRSNWA